MSVWLPSAVSKVSDSFVAAFVHNIILVKYNLHHIVLKYLGIFAYASFVLLFQNYDY